MREGVERKRERKRERRGEGGREEGRAAVLIWGSCWRKDAQTSTTHACARTHTHTDTQPPVGLRVRRIPAVRTFFFTSLVSILQGLNWRSCFSSTVMSQTLSPNTFQAAPTCRIPSTRKTSGDRPAPPTTHHLDGGPVIPKPSQK